ncbi:hypothetical protein [Phenylobacterium sp. J367]|uniref:hypothetical protein n=1 Tax=Phenylobacterium sp. J367 TaxID=2898435 RepID=UPI00215105BB|nr:hypothetical protein [Phenylobacterium sp. J367]MCR5880296.1 hypothetical protein [Phenylobacterium sp. J367]
MDVERLSPASRELLLQALPAGQLINVLYADGARDEAGFDRDRRCFALGERGWLSFLGWEGEPAGGEACATRWALTGQALEALGGSETRAA